jgi:hypothetical protein
MSAAEATAGLRTRADRIIAIFFIDASSTKMPSAGAANSNARSLTEDKKSLRDRAATPADQFLVKRENIDSTPHYTTVGNPPRPLSQLNGLSSVFGALAPNSEFPHFLPRGRRGPPQRSSFWPPMTMA